MVFVADAQQARDDANAEYFGHLDENLRKAGLPFTIPYVLQVNKCDLPEETLVPLEVLGSRYGRGGKVVAASALRGDGVADTLQWIVRLLETRDGIRVSPSFWSDLASNVRPVPPTAPVGAVEVAAPRLGLWRRIVRSLL